jgi:Protein of unknown function (DUF3276)
VEKDLSNNGKYSGFFSKKLRAGKRRTYFFDVRSTKEGDFFLTITESKKKFEGDGYDSHKIFLYKEDFKKFLEALNETVDYIKTELLPEYDYDSERPARAATEHPDSEREEHSVENRKPINNAVNKTSEASAGTATPHISDDEQVDWN